MDITPKTTVREILDKRPDALSVFAKHGVEVEAECPDAILDFPLEDCESCCHIDDLNALIQELMQFVNSESLPT